MSSLEPGASRSRQAPEETNERRLTGWQRAVLWLLWLTFLGLALAVRGFEVTAPASGGSSFTARRK